MVTVGRPCSACNSPYRSAVDYDLASGATAGSVARRYGLSGSGVYRHKERGHHQRNIAATVAAVTPGASLAIERDSTNQVQSLLAQASEMLPRLQKALLGAEAANDRTNFVKIAGELRKWIEMLFNVYGAFPKNGSTSIDARSVTINTIKDLSKDELLALASGTDAIDGEFVDA